MKNPKIFYYFGLLTILLLYVGFIISRLIPFDIDHVVYMCQSVLQDLPSTTIYIMYLVFTLFIAKIALNYFSAFWYLRDLIYTPIPSHLNRILERHNLTDKVMIYKSNEPEAYCIGLLHPKIYLSSKLVAIMEYEEIESILIHERYHLKNKNNLIIFAFNIFSSILFLFPFIKDLSKQYELHEEIEADKMACTYLKKNAPLLKALKKLILYKSPSIKYGMGFSKAQEVEYRVKSLIKNEVPKTTFSFKTVGISLISFIILSLFLFLPISKTHIQAEGKDFMVICYDNDNSNCHNICRNNIQLKQLYTPVKYSSTKT